MANNDTNQQPERFSTKISEDINCSICLDIMVCPQTFVPCGHSFCRSCCTSKSLHHGARSNRNELCFTKCPQCRQNVERMVPSRQLGNLIETLVTVPNLLFENDDDKQHYLKRRKMEDEFKIETTSRKRPRHDDKWSVFRPPTPTNRPTSTHSRSYTNSRSYIPPPLQDLDSPRESTTGVFHHFHGLEVERNSSTARPAHRQTYITNIPDFYDPMVAPLPPPYDFNVGGTLASLTFSAHTATASSSASTGQTARLETHSEAVSHSEAINHCLAPRSMRGVSATDPICIE